MQVRKWHADVLAAGLSVLISGCAAGGTGTQASGSALEAGHSTSRDPVSDTSAPEHIVEILRELTALVQARKSTLAACQQGQLTFTFTATSSRIDAQACTYTVGNIETFLDGHAEFSFPATPGTGEGFSATFMNFTNKRTDLTNPQAPMVLEEQFLNGTFRCTGVHVLCTSGNTSLEEALIRTIVERQETASTTKNIDLYMRDLAVDSPEVRKAIQGVFRKYESLTVSFAIQEIHVEGERARVTMIQTTVLRPKGISKRLQEARVRVLWELESVHGTWKIRDSQRLGNF